MVREWIYFTNIVRQELAEDKNPDYVPLLAEHQTIQWYDSINPTAFIELRVVWKAPGSCREFFPGNIGNVCQIGAYAQPTLMTFLAIGNVRCLRQNAGISL